MLSLLIYLNEYNRDYDYEKYEHGNGEPKHKTRNGVHCEEQHYQGLDGGSFINNPLQLQFKISLVTF